MNRLHQLAGACAFAVTLGFSASAAAQQARTVETAVTRDGVCTECHDPSAKKPILAIYQTRHGVKADAGTPACQDCHGESDIHVKDAGKPTDIVFGAHSKNLSTAEVRNTTCLTCHAASEARAHWAGSQHESKGVACNDCHNIHTTEQKVLSKATQAEVCFTCHKEQRAQTHRISTHPLTVTSLAGAAKMACSDCHNPHGSTGPTLLIKNSVN